LNSTIDFKQWAKTISYEERKQHLLALSETEIHRHLKTLFERMSDKTQVEITHGSGENGSDLVIKRWDAFGEDFTGVVVEKGNAQGKITGDTAGVVDEIKSHITQALTQPCYLREISSVPVSISSIWVIFVGRLTEKATKRIERESGAALIRTYPVGWLIEKFTDVYPEIFYDALVADFIQRKAEDLETRREFQRRSTSLSASFVDPWVSKPASAEDLMSVAIEILRSRRLPFNKLENILSTSSRIIITGDPGTGKSTALAKIALDIMQGNFTKKGRSKKGGEIELPILSKASEIARLDYDSFLAQHLPPEPTRSKVRVKVLLIDALDEIKPDLRINWTAPL